MRTHVKAVAVALAAAMAALALLAGSSSANRLSVSSQRFYIQWDESSERFRLESDLGPSECDLTLLGSFHSRTIRKVSRTLIGWITHATIRNCSEEMRILAESLPWHLTYESFTGVLPRISSLQLLIVGMALLLVVGGGLAECLGTSGPEDTFKMQTTVEANGRVIAALPDPDAAIDLADLSGSILCDLMSGSVFSGAGRVEDGAGGPLAVSLI